jgi:hypothetical protein
MGTARQLIPTFVDAQPLYWDRSYVQNMRSIRGYPNWWRIRDDESYIDGPVTEGDQYTRDLYIWRADIVKDEQGANTDTIELYNLIESLTRTDEVIDGETVYSYKYTNVLPSLSYVHTDVIDSVSLEFDQIGRRTIAFESMGDVFLIWFDSLAGSTVTTNWGAGYTPQIVTDSYTRTGSAADSTRILFYIDASTNQIVYRLQADRFGVVYTLPNAPQAVVEILKVSKNLYGGLTVLYVYDDTTGELVTGSFTALDGTDRLRIGSDGNDVSRNLMTPSFSELTLFSLKEAVVSTSAQVNLNNLQFTSGAITNFELRPAQVFLNTQTSTAVPLSSASGSVTNFFLKSAVVSAGTQTSNATPLTYGTGTVTNFVLKETLISLNPQSSTAVTLSSTSGSLTTFTLG